MWITDGEKYALVRFEVKLEGTPPPEQISPNLWVLTATTFDIPSEWRDWLGSIRTDEVAGSNLFLFSKLASATPDILDGENQSLQQRVQHFYVGLLLSVMFSPSHKLVMLTGARRDGVIDIRQQMDLELPAPQVFRPYPLVVADDILLAAQLGQKLNAMLLATEPGEFWWFFRTLHLYVETRAVEELLDRIHQYCRCIDGLILPAIGKTKQQFKSQTELFIGPAHHDLMGALYDIRSHVEHLHENRYLETFDRDVRLDLSKKRRLSNISHARRWRGSSAKMCSGRISAIRRRWKSFGRYRRTIGAKFGATPLTPWCLLQISTRNICTTDISGRPNRLLKNPWHWWDWRDSLVGQRVRARRRCGARTRAAGVCLAISTWSRG